VNTPCVISIVPVIEQFLHPVVTPPKEMIDVSLFEIDMLVTDDFVVGVEVGANGYVTVGEASA